jgi:hypothetical protein
MPAPVANPLTLLMTLKSDADYQALKARLESLNQQPGGQNPITAALTRIGTVHFARFVFLNETQLAVITTFDGDFEQYIDAFVNAIGTVFDELLGHMKDAPPLPVSTHRKEFLEYVRQNDRKPVGGLYSAYPDLKVLDILTLQKNQSGS